MKTFFLIVFVLLLGSCGQTDQRHSVNSVLKNSETLVSESDQASESEIDSISLLMNQLITKSIHTSIGDSLVLNEFEKEWELVGYSDMEVDKRSESEKWLNNLSYHLVEKYNLNENSAIVIDEKYFHRLLNITPSTPDHLFENKMLNKQFSTIIINVSEHQNYKLYSILTEKIRFEYDSEFGLNAQIQSLVTISNHNKIIGNLIVAYSIGDGYSISDQFFFYDKEFIHIKLFGGGEGEAHFVGYQKYQITPQGKFIRYYEQDGILKNDEEQGLVKNHTREGKWVEMNNVYFIEAEYKEGLPINEWKYYKIVQNFTEDGIPILSSRKKGKLLYTEIYANGTLVKREFIK